MSHEIYYTSAPEGLKRGTSGFCTVAASDNIPRPLLERLETLSAYRHHFAMNADGTADVGSAILSATGHGYRNPVSQGHSILSVMGKTYHVLSRICDSGVDHTHRTNAFAHHLVLETAEMERATGGPAWMLAQPGVMADAWDGQVRSLTRTRLPEEDTPPASLICKRWAAATGDAGWGGHLADLFAKSPTRPVCILFAPGQELLELMAEAIALLPAATRWNVTFNTYFTSMPTSATCLWRCCLAGTPAAQVGVRYGASGLVLDLTDPGRLGSAPAGPYMTKAREGLTTGGMGKTPSAATRAAKPLRPATAKPLSADLDNEEEELERQRAEIFELAGEEDEQDSKAGSPSMFAQGETYTASPVQPVATTTPDSWEAPAANTPALEVKLPIKKATAATMRRADEALAEVDIESSRLAERRRKQVVKLLLGALALIAVGMGLMWVAYKKSAPPDFEEAPRAVVARPSLPGRTAPAPTLVIKDPIPEVVVPPTEVTQTPAIPVLPPEPTPTAVPLVFPATIALTDTIERPNPGNGIGDRTQIWPLRATDIDAPEAVTALRLLLARSREGAAATDSSGIVYESESAGSLRAIAETRNAKPGLALQWKAGTKGTTSSFTEVAFLAFDRRGPALELQWHSAPLLKNPAVVTFIYWVLSGNSVQLTGPHTGQRITFRRFEPGTVAIADATLMIAWPMELSQETVVIPPAVADLPAGWEASWYTDWETKDTPLRSAANASQVIKFKKQASGSDAWFLITFRPGLARADSTYSKRLATDRADQADAAKQLQAIDAKIDQAKAEFKGVLPDTPGAREFQAEHDKCVARVNATNAAVAAYQELKEFDVAFDMPGALRLATLHFKQGDVTAETGK